MADILIYKKGKMVKATKYDLFIRKITHIFNKWKIVNTSKYCLVPWNDCKKQFTLSDKEYKESKKVFKDKGTISYEFYPTGIGWGIRIHVEKTGEIIDITDVSKW